MKIFRSLYVEFSRVIKRTLNACIRCLVGSLDVGKRFLFMTHDGTRYACNDFSAVGIGLPVSNLILRHAFVMRSFPNRDELFTSLARHHPDSRSTRVYTCAHGAHVAHGAHDAHVRAR